MLTAQNRRNFLTMLSVTGAAGLVPASESLAQEAPPEVSTIRLAMVPGICIAPQYVAEAMLKLEGFSDGPPLPEGTPEGTPHFAFPGHRPRSATTDAAAPLTWIETGPR